MKAPSLAVTLMLVPSAGQLDPFRHLLIPLHFQVLYFCIFCWNLYRGSYMFDLSSVNAISSIPCVAYQCRKASRRVMTVNFSLTSRESYGQQWNSPRTSKPTIRAG
ncbi:uncharacterized protein FOBCDRAFT_232371 [Fusarium oxysporum Fo47]|uniref:uncharacterized protein n=1 Tax=Fusarium oxysporum Fo47 TaxID=660027 RepID=UPI002869AE28|nr:uncharacterized protein FOBCDRAFT_232371 [Fusarium oxysporum Fo47]WJG36953.1 hypothetical protein FOBCDRAFT_232371 [Fusarium oxysporum Fo47]